jgi:2-amino-4-hydroxy-6-hydroxymethyldihydropteridine diphosphokinase
VTSPSPAAPAASPGPYRLAVGLGSSLGDRERHLALAVASLAALPATRLLRTSALVRTPPMRGGTARNWFLNAVALFETRLSPEEVLDRCVALEQRAGRRRARFWMDRPLDLDLLMAEGLVLDTPRLVLPHPAVATRAFVLGPLLSVWPDAVDPRTGRRWAELPSPTGPKPAFQGRLPAPRAIRPL